MPEQSKLLKKSPDLFTIPPHVSFVDGLATGIFERYGDDPLILSEILILLPNRRAVRSLRDAFLRASGGKSMILPRIEPIGDVDEDELLLSDSLPHTLPQGATDLLLAPAIPSFMRQMLLMEIIERWYQGRHEPLPDKAQAALLASSLGQFLDHVQTEQLTFRDLEKLVPEEYAHHWQQTLDFLKILTGYWPDILATTGYSDSAARRNHLLENLRQSWLAKPPTHPVIAAGSTGSIPATSQLLAVIARLPEGCVVLPGLDLAMAPECWDRLDDTHPQMTMKQLLKNIGANRDMVKDWHQGSVAAHRIARTRLLQEVMRPAQTTDRWLSLDLDLAAATRGLSRLTAPGPGQEAGMIALMLRKALETDGKTAALVTPDRHLARRVAGELRRWAIQIDDSAGTPLFNTPPGLYLRLLARMMGEQMAPVALLSVLKHPLSAGGQQIGHFRQMTRRLEEKILRGPRPGAGSAGISRAIESALQAKKNKERRGELNQLALWWQELGETFAPFEQAMKRENNRFEDLLVSHIELAERLATSEDKTGEARLWTGEAGEEAAHLIEELHQAAPHLPQMVSDHYPALLEVFMGDLTVRPKYGQHPRLNIWGPLEARLQHVDLVILAGLNEGSWPPEAVPDPWMSRPMRTKFGLPSLEQKIGLSAHDFIQAASAPEVVLIRSEKTDGTPTVQSRWLSRMAALLPEKKDKDWQDLYEILDKPSEKVTLLPPRPSPPLSARPRALSVTRIQKWMQDPYSIYAQYILKLSPLDPLDGDPGAADKGTIIHDALDQFMRQFSDHLPGDAVERLIEIGSQKFERYLDRPTVQAFWWPRFCQLAHWFVATEKTRRLTSKTVATEIDGDKLFDLPGGSFILKAKADRIDRLADGSYSIIDYKTGQSPTLRQIHAGYAPQLPLEGLLLQGGNFQTLPAGLVSDLSYWQLKGGEEVARISSFNLTSRTRMDVGEVIKDSFDGLVKLITSFDLPETPYLNNPRPNNLGYGEYDHLARTKEWQGNDLGGNDLGDREQLESGEEAS